jgi:hypothetical protein
MPYINRTTTQADDTTYIAGMKKRCTATTVISIDGEPYTPAALSAIFQAEIDTGTAVVPAKAAWQKAVSDAKSAKLAAAAVRPGFEQWVQATYGKDPQALADFGVPAKKPRVVKPATKVAAATKAAATRAAGGSKAKKQQAASPAPAATTPAPGTVKS